MWMRLCLLSVFYVHFVASTEFMTFKGECINPTNTTASLPCLQDLQNLQYSYPQKKRVNIRLPLTEFVRQVVFAKTLSIAFLRPNFKRAQLLTSVPSKLYDEYGYALAHATFDHHYELPVERGTLFLVCNGTAECAPCLDAEASEWKDGTCKCRGDAKVLEVVGVSVDIIPIEENSRAQLISVPSVPRVKCQRCENLQIQAPGYEFNCVCMSNSTEITNNLVSTCQCKSGFEFVAHTLDTPATCKLCESGFFKLRAENSGCRACPAREESNEARDNCACKADANLIPEDGVSLTTLQQSTNQIRCVCDAGFQWIEELQVCEKCPIGYYSSSRGSVCVKCSTAGGGTNLARTSCQVCAKNSITTFIGCVECGKNEIVGNNNTCISPSRQCTSPRFLSESGECVCDANSSPIPNSAVCRCNAGYKRRSSGRGCVRCPQGEYRPNNDDDSTCIPCGGNDTRAVPVQYDSSTWGDFEYRLKGFHTRTDSTSAASCGCPDSSRLQLHYRLDYSSPGFYGEEVFKAYKLRMTDCFCGMKSLGTITDTNGGTIYPFENGNSVGQDFVTQTRFNFKRIEGFDINGFEIVDVSHEKYGPGRVFQLKDPGVTVHPSRFVDFWRYRLGYERKLMHVYMLDDTTGHVLPYEYTASLGPYDETNDIFYAFTNHDDWQEGDFLFAYDTNLPEKICVECDGWEGCETCGEGFYWKEFYGCTEVTLSSETCDNVWSYNKSGACKFCPFMQQYNTSTEECACPTGYDSTVIMDKMLCILPEDKLQAKLQTCLTPISRSDDIPNECDFICAGYKQVINGKQCVCDIGYERNTTLGRCQLCPLNTKKGSKGDEECTACGNLEVSIGDSRRDCTCAAGAFQYDSTCTPCRMGTFKDWDGPEACKNCPTNQTLPREGSSSENDCVCEEGFHRVGGTCELCPLNTFKNVSGDTGCEPCQPRTASLNVSYRLDCTCDVGAFWNGSECTPCVIGTFKDTVGTQACTSCSNEKTTRAEGASNASQCLCAAGRYHADALCAPCPADTFSKEIGARSETSCLPCPFRQFNPFEGRSSCLWQHLVLTDSGMDADLIEIVGLEVTENQTCAILTEVKNGYLEKSIRLCWGGGLASPTVENYEIPGKRCGDAFLFPNSNEECDDGNLEPDDGCSLSCKIEKGFQCEFRDPANITTALTPSRCCNVSDTESDFSITAHCDLIE